MINALKNIQQFSINNVPLEELDSKFFHFCGDEYIDIYDSVGISEQLGPNSKGLDFEPSIFFSKGSEGVLELWDFWLRWKTNKIFNPFHNKESAFSENVWHQKFVSGEFMDDNDILNITFETIINEMLVCSYYILDLKENEEFVYNQIDYKKKNALEAAKEKGYIEPMLLMMYGNYADYSNNYVDKWNMQTIPSKNITIPPNRLKIVTYNGKTDLITVIQFLYDKYQKESSNPLKFPILDKFINYVKNNYKRTD